MMKNRKNIKVLIFSSQNCAFSFLETKNYSIIDDKEEKIMLSLKTLNDKQMEAVLHTEGPLLILAGAGSGKTKVLTTKIAYLIEEKDVSPFEILAITFTNKAAKEMKTRLIDLV